MQFHGRQLVSLCLWEAGRGSGYEHRLGSQLFRTVLSNDLTFVCPACIVGKRRIPRSVVRGFIVRLEAYHRKLVSDRTLQLYVTNAQSYFFCRCSCHPAVLILWSPCSAASPMSDCRAAKLSCGFTGVTHKISDSVQWFPFRQVCPGCQGVGAQEVEIRQEPGRIPS